MIRAGETQWVNRSVSDFCYYDPIEWVLRYQTRISLMFEYLATMIKDIVLQNLISN